jgi:hypothetical protein
MKDFEAKDETSIRILLNHLNSCHDGWTRRISFTKNREYGEDDNVFYSDEGTGSEVGCDIEIELLLDSYNGALPRQMVTLIFHGVRVFRFLQDDSFDYSEIYEVVLDRVEEGKFEFSFRAVSKRTVFLTLSCSRVTCREYQEEKESQGRVGEE